ncbi:MAG: NAD-dependent epimerase/dehydratase family protein, partial [Candidatus Omnitrophica bacterium]|nr:NAD-dependent epimerase/dehydratase family protein [Candidatus Omnitrophota bacterium]
MKIVLVTGAAGLVGSEAVEFFSGKFDRVVGVDNDLRKEFFGKEASTEWNQKRLLAEVAKYEHVPLDVRDQPRIEKLFKKYSSDITLVVHAAAQPSHDWAAGDPFTDFTVNANGTLNLLEATRHHCPKAVFIFTSTNKVYGDTPNSLPLKELDSRWELEESHPYSEHGIDETMSIDACKHSLFGASKV